jgi:hypothetical protein
MTTDNGDLIIRVWMFTHISQRFTQDIRYWRKVFTSRWFLLIRPPKSRRERANLNFVELSSNNRNPPEPESILFTAVPPWGQSPISARTPAEFKCHRKPKPKCPNCSHGIFHLATAEPRNKEGSKIIAVRLECFRPGICISKVQNLTCFAKLRMLKA